MLGTWDGHKGPVEEISEALFPDLARFIITAGPDRTGPALVARHCAGLGWNADIRWIVTTGCTAIHASFHLRLHRLDLRVNFLEYRRGNEEGSRVL